LDRALVLIFHAPRSYTGEHTVEIQCHGGSQSPQKILDALLDVGARLALPGEFTQRAFLNGRIDLTQAEAVLDLLNARTSRAATAAQEQLGGRLRSSFDHLYDELLDIAATLEHHLDFNDDELSPELLTQTSETLIARGKSLCLATTRLVETFREGHLLRDGATVVIAGPPNAGKSTLMNALLGRDRAIVTPIPGTTRDTLEEFFNLRGIPVRLVDTAGLRETDCPVEALGVGRAREALRDADAVLYVVDATEPGEVDVSGLPQERTLLLFNKSDLLDGPRQPSTAIDSHRIFNVSALRAETLAPVLDALHALLLDAAPASETTGACVSSRHRQILVASLAACHEALPLLRDPADWPLAASALRNAANEVAMLTGRRYTEDLLDRVFSRFCVGK